jgi:hypothetical protein
LKTGDAWIAWNAALELEQVGLEDALALVLLVVDDPRFERAGARWLGRLCLEVSTVTVHQAQLVASALSGLPDRSAAIALSGACTELGLERAAAATRAKVRKVSGLRSCRRPARDDHARQRPPRLLEDSQACLIASTPCVNAMRSLFATTPPRSCPIGHFSIERLTSCSG